jgi:sterol 14-demethylase
MDFQIISGFTEGGDFQWAKFGTAAFLAVLLSALAFLSYTPRVHQKSPAFTSHKLPFIGSLGFTTEQW